MKRNQIVVGDAPACGGAVLPTEGQVNTWFGHQFALVGARVFCAGCQSVGLIAKAGGPYRCRFFGAEQALEGDVVACACETPPLLVSSMNGSARNTVDDRDGSKEVFQPGYVYPDWYRPDAEGLAKSKEIVGRIIKYEGEEKESERICPEMTNAGFAELMLKTRDRAVHLIERRMTELAAWSDSEVARFQQWFGRTDRPARNYVHAGFARCVTALKDLKAVNFIRYDDAFAESVGCLSVSPINQVAAVCRSDTVNHKIAFARAFCALRGESGGFDSKLSTLIHEVTHFQDVFGAEDPSYSFSRSIEMAKTDIETPKRNADSLAGYIVWDTNYAT